MISDRPLSRRDFSRAAAAVALSPNVLSALGHDSRKTSAPLAPAAWPEYERAIIIDMLASVTPFNVPDMYGRPLSSERLTNAKASGITAINATCNSFRPGAAGFIETVSNIAYWERECRVHPDVLMKVRSIADIADAKRTKRIGVILGFQDSTMLEGDVSRVNLFYELGVRVIQLTYNLRNQVGDGCLEPANAGLSNFGRDVVRRMNELGILVDLSHVGRQTTTDAIAHSTKPVSATHTGCAALNDVPRNKPDAILRAMAAKGGVAGIYLMPFLRAQGQPGADDFVRHVNHAVNVCGEDHVGVGSDLSITPLDLTPEFRALHAGFVRQRVAAGISAPGEAADVFNYVPEFNTPRRMELIADALSRAGHSSSRIEKIVGGNWVRLLREVWTQG